MPGRLYIKIFLSFIGVIVVAMFMVAMLFRFTEGEKFASRFKRLARAQVVMVRSTVEDRAAANPEYRNEASEPMQDLLNKLGEAYLAKIWLTDDNGNVLVQSFKGPVPSPLELEPEDDDDDDDYDHTWHHPETFQVNKCDDSPHCIYVVIPFGGTNGIESGNIHYFYQDPRITKHEKIFVLGLIGICVSVALLIMPVSWIITRRLKQLRASALRIADGDLSHRANICGKDEVTGVGRALNRMADSLSRMIRGSQELTANVSHELRTPLTRIRIAEEILQERFGEDGAAHLDSIREDVEALDKLIGRMLTLSKLDLKEDPFTIEPVDVAELTNTIADRLTPIAKHRDLTVTTDIPGEAVIEADGEALLTALGSVFENGVKHADRGGELKFSLTQDDSSVTVTTENSHSHLPEDELKAIFEPFRRAKGTVNQGTGLGLAIAHKIIERHGGTVHAENCDGGVRFVVVIPKDVSSDQD